MIEWLHLKMNNCEAGSGGIAIICLFTKLPWPEDSEGPFGRRVELPPAHLSTPLGGGFTLSLNGTTGLVTNYTSSRKLCSVQTFCFDSTGNRPEFTVSGADALSARH